MIIQNGTFYYIQSDGNHITNSIGSTSWAITTSLAFFYSTRVVTWLRPNLIIYGFLVVSYFYFLSTMF